MNQIARKQFICLVYSAHAGYSPNCECFIKLISPKLICILGSNIKRLLNVSRSSEFGTDFDLRFFMFCQHLKNEK